MEANTGMAINWDEFKDKAEAVVSNLGASGLLCGDEIDDSELNVCLLVPESVVALLIGKAGANINTTKAVSGANVSFQKKENSVRGYRKCFHTGPLASVMRAVSVALSFVQETTGGVCSATIVVNHDAAGGVIGKGGENLKQIREQTSCKVSMEKSQEAMPAYGGRCLTLEHEEAAQVSKAIYLCIRSKGFSSPSARDDQAGPASDGGYGPASGNKGQAARWSPYGAAGVSRQDTCAIHGKRRGKQNLRQSPSVPGQYICLETDQCKGSALPQAMGGAPSYMMGAGMGGGMGGAMGGMGAGMGGAMGAGMGGMGGAGMGMGGMGLGMGDMGMFSGMYGMGGMGAPMASNVCAIHGKKRGPKNLQPHPSQPGLMMCMEHDSCKGSGAVDMGGAIQQDMSSMCATHGKRRGARNLQPHASQPGLFVCMEEDACK